MPSKIKSPRLGLNDIHANILLVQNFTAAVDSEAFLQNKEKVYAVIRCLEILSEASRRLPKEIHARHPQITWQAIAAAGNFYRHEYEGITDVEIWNVVKTDLPPLLMAVQKELASLPEANG